MEGTSHTGACVVGAVPGEWWNIEVVYRWFRTNIDKMCDAIVYIHDFNALLYTPVQK